MQYCTQPCCGVVVEKGRCLKHRVRENHDVRKWYRTQRWIRLRTVVLAEEPLCMDCLDAGRTTPATEVHHIRKHMGDEGLFYGRHNLRGLCKSCHSTHTQRGE
jgi:5-methylcytosine-specific restriction protein A